MFEKDAEKFMKNVFPYEDEEPVYGEEQVKRLLSLFAEYIYNKVKVKNGILPEIVLPKGSAEHIDEIIAAA